MTKESKTYRLLPVENPLNGTSAYRVPRLEIRQSLKKGYFVKLSFEAEKLENGAMHERLWVEVTGGTAKLFTGVLRSSPAFLKDLIPGEPILFGPEHVCEVSLS